MEESVSLKCPYYPKQATDNNAISIKIAMVFFTELEQIIPNFVWNHKRFQIATAILGKKYYTPRLEIILQSHINQKSKT